MLNSTKAHEKVMYKSFFSNLILVIVKVVGGFLFRSAALIADGVHSLSDLLTDTMVVFGIRHSAKPADREHPLGHGKFEYVISIFLGISILFMAYQIIQSAIVNFNNGVEVPSLLGIYVVAFAILTKLLLSRYVIAKGKALESQALLASGKESFGDVLSSVIVLVGILLTVVGSRFDVSWLLYGDRIASLVIGLFIVKLGLEIIVDAVRSILGKSAPEMVRTKTKREAENVEGVIGVDHLDMIVYGHYYHVMIDIRVAGDMTVSQGHDIASEVKEILMKNKKIAHVIVHVNPEVR